MGLISGWSNIGKIVSFASDLDAYEAAAPTTAMPTAALEEAIGTLKFALFRIVFSTDSDALSMLRILSQRITLHATTVYSPALLTYAAANTVDEQARQLIMALVYKMLDVTQGEAVTFTTGDIAAIQGSDIIQTFLVNYPSGDPSLPLPNQTILTPADTDPWTVIHATGSSHTHAMDVGKYAISLDGAPVTTLQFQTGTSPSIPEDTQWVGEVWLKPLSPSVVLSRSIGFTENAVLQASDLNIFTNTYIAGADTSLTMSAFDTLRLVLVFDKDMQMWVIAELFVLSPATAFPQ